MPGVDPLVSSLPTFSGTPFFLGDEMHLIGRGISTLVYNLLNPQKNEKFKTCSIVNSANYTFQLSSDNKNIFGVIDSRVNNSRVDIPSAFEGTWSSSVGISRAVDYLDFLLYIVPTIMIPLIKNDHCKSVLMNLVDGCSIALQWRISAADIVKMRK